MSEPSDDDLMRDIPAHREIGNEDLVYTRQNVIFAIRSNVRAELRRLEIPLLERETLIEMVRTLVRHCDDPNLSAYCRGYLQTTVPNSAFLRLSQL